jgi:hypothetical protein
MIGLFIKSGRGCFWEALLWLLVLELARVIGGPGRLSGLLQQIVYTAPPTATPTPVVNSVPTPMAKLYQL